MTTYPYLIIGGGMTAAAAVDGIREADPKGAIALFSTETDPPYDRPPLSKKLWKGKPLESIWRKIEGKGVEARLGRTVVKVIPEKKQVLDDKGEAFGYQKLLLATGGRPRRLPFGNGGILYFRTLSDYRKLRTLCGTGKRFAVIGGGFIGSEIAAALSLNGKETVLVFPGKEIGDRIFPRPLAQYVSAYYEKKGVEVLPNERILGLETRDNRFFLKTGMHGEIGVDGVVAGIGIEPDTDLAVAAGLKTDNGIVVDEFLQTDTPDIYSAGDAAAFHNPLLGKRMRVEHEDNANTMGKTAGRNMAGIKEPYRHLPYFYSDLFELGYEAVGETDAGLETFVDWKRPNEEGVIYYLRDRRVRGVLLWNVWDQVENARKLMAEPGPFTAENLKGRLPA